MRSTRKPWVPLVAGAFAACHAHGAGSGLPPDVVWSSGTSGGMPGSSSTSVVVHRDGTSECSESVSLPPGTYGGGAPYGPDSAPPPTPTPTSTNTKGRIDAAKLEELRRALVACRFCDVEDDDKSTVPDAASVGVAVEMDGVSCSLDLTRQRWPDDHANACSDAMGALVRAACAR